MPPWGCRRDGSNLDLFAVDLEELLEPNTQASLSHDDDEEDEAADHLDDDGDRSPHVESI